MAVVYSTAAPLRHRPLQAMSDGLEELAKGKAT